jgi:hypothetical protein
MLFNSAEAAVMEEALIYQQRVDAARLSIMYAELEIARAMPPAPNGLFEKDSTVNWQAKPYYEELLETFVSRAKERGHLLLHETRLTPDEYFKEFSTHLKHGAKNHLAVGKRITFETPPDARYPGAGPDALIDGFSASNSYQFGWQGWYGKDMVATIDLGTEHAVDSIVLGFLRDPQSWIFLPERVLIDISPDGETWSAYDRTELVHQAQRGIPNTFRLSAALVPAQLARHIRITAKNLGTLPPWHGSKGQCWLFCDEIVVYGE